MVSAGWSLPTASGSSGRGLSVFAKSALGKNPLRLLPVRPAPAARAGPEGLHSQPVLPTAPRLDGDGTLGSGAVRGDASRIEDVADGALGDSGARERFLQQVLSPPAKVRRDFQGGLRRLISQHQDAHIKEISRALG
jgi:hypothetical protein